MVINQQITMMSADANLANACAAAREAAEYSLREYTEKYYRPRGNPAEQKGGRIRR